MTRPLSHVLPLPPLLVLSLALTISCGDAEPDAAEAPEHHQHDAQRSEHAEVKLSPQGVAAARLVITPVTEGALSPELTLPARVALDPRRESIVSAWIGGQVDTIAVRPGDRVTKGQVLGTVLSPELGEAVAAFRVTKAKDAAADARLQRLRGLEADGVSSHAQVLQAEADDAETEASLEAAEERLRVLGVDPDIGDPQAGEHYVSHISVRSPISGKLLSMDASVGRQVAPGDRLFHLGQLDEVWLLIDLYERDLAKVSLGQAVRFTVEAWPDQVFEGSVDQVGDWVEPDSRTVEVRVVVDNQEGRLKPNMFVTATLSISRPGGARGIVLPAGAVQSLDGKDTAFVEEEPGLYQAREVAIAERNSRQALVIAGLSPGDRVVVDGAFVLKSELQKSELGEGHAD